MRTLYWLCAVVTGAVILVVGLSNSKPVEAQDGNRQVEVKRVNMSSGDASVRTLGVVVGISCLDLRTGVECFVVSTR
jgi:hypothetical protein